MSTAHGCQARSVAVGALPLSKGPGGCFRELVRYSDSGFWNGSTAMRSEDMERRSKDLSPARVETLTGVLDWVNELAQDLWVW